MPTSPALLKARREVRNLRSHLRAFVDVVEVQLITLDAAMKGPSTPERGQRIAHIAGVLELEKDIAKRFGLGVKPKKTGRPVKIVGAGP